MGYPSKREADRLERWPQRIELEDLRESFALGDSDRDLVFGPRGAENGVARSFVRKTGLAGAACAAGRRSGGSRGGSAGTGWRGDG